MMMLMLLGQSTADSQSTIATWSDTDSSMSSSVISSVHPHHLGQQQQQQLPPASRRLLLPPGANDKKQSKINWVRLDVDIFYIHVNLILACLWRSTHCECNISLCLTLLTDCYSNCFHCSVTQRFVWLATRCGNVNSFVILTNKLSSDRRLSVVVHADRLVSCYQFALSCLVNC